MYRWKQEEKNRSGLHNRAERTAERTATTIHFITSISRNATRHIASLGTAGTATIIHFITSISSAPHPSVTKTTSSPASAAMRVALREGAGAHLRPTLSVKQSMDLLAKLAAF
jgi:hypothetical protein